MGTDGGELFASDAEAATLVRRFEAGELQPSEFKHAAHLTVALWHVSRLPPGEALDAVRRSILNFLGRHSIDPSVYHETMTVFWVRRVAAFARSAGGPLPFFELANALAAECSDPRLVFDYFSKLLIDSGEARGRWVEPDLRPLDF